MSGPLIEIGIPVFVFSFVGLLIALALWIGMSKPKNCIQQAEQVIYQHQARLNRQWSAVPKCEPNE